MRARIVTAMDRSGTPMSLYDVMAATGIGGWDAAQELKAMVRAGVAAVISAPLTTLWKLV